MDGFDWDNGNTEKCLKHGVSQTDVEAICRGPLDIFPDTDHSIEETRFFGIGRTEARRYVFIAFTIRTRDGKRFVRPISARFMHAKEVTHYLKETARRQD